MRPEELAAASGTHPRYAFEWLQQQAVTGLLSVEGDRFSLPPATAEVLTDQHSLAYLSPLGRMFMAAAEQMPALLEAYRTGGGVSWSQLGADARESQADMNRPWYEHQLAPALASVPRVHELLSRTGAEVLDVGCGAGWSSIALAKACPTARISGWDVDAPSVDLARHNAGQADVADRVRFHRGDAAELPRERFDVAFAFECIHDMPQPVEVLAAVRRSLKPGGCLVVMDEAVAEHFTAPGDDLERLMYGFSLLVCLPDGMSHQPSVGTGTVMRPATLERYARKAGFGHMTVLPIEEFGFWRFYALEG
ncbi:MAG: methyltransferase domain-containing protein [Actinomycetota bacterium]|nr:methyltransferase domain-containing protein [Actinomycetota bacterium]